MTIVLSKCDDGRWRATCRELPEVEAFSVDGEAARALAILQAAAIVARAISRGELLNVDVKTFATVFA